MAAAASVAACALWAAPPAQADDPIVASWSELAAAVGPACAPGDTVELATDLQDGSARTALMSECDLTLDLHGHELVTGTLTVSELSKLTITDTAGGGVLDAGGETGTPSTGTAPGIAGTPGIETTGAALTVTGAATVTATGGVNTAGVGGADGFDGGTVTAAGTATITATGGESGAGIGGGRQGNGGVVDVQGDARVTAQGGNGGAGIGGGTLGNGGSVTISGSARGTAAGDGGGSDFGGGKWGDGGQFVVSAGAEAVAAGAQSLGESVVGAGSAGDSGGGAEVAGTLRIERGALFLMDDEDSSFTVTATGLIAGPAGDATGGGRIAGFGSLTNAGVIALTDVGADTQITGNNFDVRLHREGVADTDTVRVYAPQFADSYRTLPAPGTGYQPWRAGEDASGDPVEAGTPLAPLAETAGGDRVVTLAATGTDTAVALAASPVSTSFGEPIALTATVTAAGDTPEGTVTFRSGEAPRASHQLGSAPVDAAGVAVLDDVALGVGAHEVRAAFASPATGFRDSDAAAVVTVEPEYSDPEPEPPVVPHPPSDPNPPSDPAPPTGPSPAPDPGTVWPAPGAPEPPVAFAPVAPSIPGSGPDPGDTAGAPPSASGPSDTAPPVPASAPDRPEETAAPASGFAAPTGYGHELRTPHDVLEAGPAAQAIAAGTALGLLLLVALPLELLYGTLRQNYGRLVFVPARWSRGWVAWRSRAHAPLWRWAGTATMFLVGAGIATLAEPTLPTVATGLRLFCALLISLALMNVTAVAFGWIAARGLDLPSAVRLMPGFLLIAAAGVLVSRVFSLHPGILFGLLAMTVVTATMRRGDAGKLALTVNGSFLALGVLAWTLYGALGSALDGAGGFVGEILREVLTAVAVGCIGAVAIALLPITFMGGRDVFRWSKPIWILVYAVTLLLFVFVVLPMPESWQEARGPGLFAALVFGGFGVLSLSVWAWFRFRPARRTTDV